MMPLEPGVAPGGGKPQRPVTPDMAETVSSKGQKNKNKKNRDQANDEGVGKGADMDEVAEAAKPNKRPQPTVEKQPAVKMSKAAKKKAMKLAKKTIKLCAKANGKKKKCVKLQGGGVCKFARKKNKCVPAN